MTYYNNRIYTITEVMFNMNPTHKFKLADGKETTYAQYLLDNYKIKLQYPKDQPMIRCHIKRTGQDVYLVPECCLVTGITEQQKGKNFRDIKDDMFANAERKQRQAQAFFEAIKRNKDKYKALSLKYKIEVDESPLVINAYNCKPCKVIGNDKKEVDLKVLQKERDFSHYFTGPLKGVKLTNWAIFYAGFAKREFTTFVSELQNTVKNDYATSCSKPKTIQIEGKDFEARNWINAIQETQREENLQCCILIVPGRKGASPVYD